MFIEATSGFKVGEKNKQKNLSNKQSLTSQISSQLNHARFFFYMYGNDEQFLLFNFTTGNIISDIQFTVCYPLSRSGVDCIENVVYDFWDDHRVRQTRQKGGMIREPGGGDGGGGG